jgi:hypothetical protein
MLLVELPSGGFGPYNAKIGPPYSFWIEGIRRFYQQRSSRFETPVAPYGELGHS